MRSTHSPSLPRAVPQAVVQQQGSYPATGLTLSSCGHTLCSPMVAVAQSQAEIKVLCHFALRLWYGVSSHILHKNTCTFSREHICLQKRTPWQSLNQPQMLLHME